MTATVPAMSECPASIKRAAQYFQEASAALAGRVDRMFIWLLAAEWLGSIAAALIFSPRTWSGSRSSLHPHLWAAIGAGPAFILPAILVALLYPRRQFTRHGIAVAQMLVSTLLIDVTGGRIETHFHIFGSLAFLAFYRDWRVIVTASAVTALDHWMGGMWWPRAVYGVSLVSPWRWVEHAWWVVFEDIFLILAVSRSKGEMRDVACTRAQLYIGAYHDVLTGLGNRRMLQENFESRPRSQEGPVSALLFIDLDRFKQANDTHGHAAGDKLLKMVAARLSAQVGEPDTLARIGGDEFVVLLESAACTDDVMRLGNKLLNALIEPFDLGEHRLLLSASVGISLCPEHGTELSVLQESADCAMYAAKSRGRNQVAVFSAQVAERSDFVADIGRDLYRALEKKEFRLHFQPLMTKGGEIVGFEALLRWEHPVHGLVQPGNFIPLAERSGLILQIGEWVLREACRNCVSWQRPGEPAIGVAVNISALQFEQRDFRAQVADILKEFRMKPSLLTLELTESVLLRNITNAREQLEELRRSGVRIALDDFGTGYSSLSYLSTLVADTIKLDRSFLKRESANGPAVVRSIIEMAHRIGLRVVGEGVENRSQSEWLIDMECDELQGFYFSRPMLPGDVHSFVAEHQPEAIEAV